MNRRGLLSALAAFAGLARARAEAAPTGATKVVYHLVDADKAAFVLGNLANHLEGAPGVELAVVIHGPALKLFLDNAPNRAIVLDARDRLKAGVTFYACAHTMAAQGWTLPDFIAGFRVAEKGGVVQLADLQAQGWVYLRP